MSFKKPFCDDLVIHILLMQLFTCFLCCISVTANSQESFKGYYVQHFNSETGLPNTIKGLQQDQNGFTWIATESGVVRFDGMRFRMYDRSEKGEAINRLINVGMAPNGQIFIQTEEKGFYKVTPHNTLVALPNDSSYWYNQHFTPPNIFAAKLYEKCKTKYSKKEIPGWALPATSTNGHSYANNIIRQAGSIFYLNNQDEIVSADTALRTFNRLNLISGGKAKRSSISASISLISYLNQVYIRFEDTLYSLSIAANQRDANLTPLFPVGNISNINYLLKLPADDIFILGTVSDGIYVFRKQPFTSLLTGNDKYNIFYAHAPFGDNGACSPQGILLPDRFIPFKETFFPRSILKTVTNTYLLNRRDDAKGSIYEMNESLQKIREIPFNRPIYCFLQTRDSIIWFSSDTAFLARIDGDRLDWVSRPSAMPKRFRINTFIEAGDHVFWIGGKEGLLQANLKTGQVRKIPTLDNIFVRSLYKDPQGTLWIGTYGNGFYALYKDQLVAFPLDREHYLEYVHTFMPDQSGRLWMSTNRGLFAFHIQDLYKYLETPGHLPFYFYFDNTSGFLSNEFNGGCNPNSIRMGNGKFSFPSLKGLVQFYPDSIQPSSPSANIFIDEIISDTTVLSFSSDKIMIPRNAERIRFYISSPYYGNHYNQVIEYCLDNPAEKWHTLNNDYIIEMSKPSNGNHTLLLRMQKDGSFFTPYIKSFSFSVEPFIWETVSFKLVLLALALLLLYGFYRFRIRILVRQKVRLESMVTEKTKEQNLLIQDLETVVSELEQSREALQKNVSFKETLSMIVTHDLQSPLRFLSNASEQLDRKNSYTDDETRKLGNELKKTSSNIYQLVKDFGIWIEKANVYDKTNVEEVNLSALLYETAAFFEELRKISQNEILVEIIPDICVLGDYQMLKIILRNLVDNANKYTKNGTIFILLKTSGNEATIEIRDTGIGMKQSVVESLLINIQHAGWTQKEEKIVSGLGYRFIGDFCQALDISLSIASEPGKGTHITLSNLKTCHSGS